MKLIQLKCPSCGAELETSVGDKIKCKYCGAEILVDDEKIKVEHEVIDVDKEEQIKSAEAYIKFGDFEKAFSIYKNLSEKYAYDSEIWYKMLFCLTRNFNYNLIDSTGMSIIFYDCITYYDKYMLLEENDNKKKNVKKLFDDYVSMVNKKYDEFNKKQEEARKRDMIFIFSFFGFMGLILLIVFIISIFDSYKEKTYYEKLDSIDVYNMYYNDNLNSSKGMTELSNKNPLYLHFTVDGGIKKKDRKLEYKVYLNGTFQYSKDLDVPYGDDYWYLYWDDFSSSGFLSVCFFNRETSKKLDCKAVNVIE